MCNNNVEKLVKSHIIPESFFRAIKKDSNHLLIVSNKESEFTKRNMIGIYDQEILCLNCEEKFKLLDDYGQDILIKNQDAFRPIIDTEKNTTVGWVMNKKINFKMINKFFYQYYIEQVYRIEIFLNIYHLAHIKTN